MFGVEDVILENDFLSAPITMSDVEGAYCFEFYIFVDICNDIIYMVMRKQVIFC